MSDKGDIQEMLGKGLDKTLTDPLFFLSQYVLAVGSSVFCAMFYGDLAEGDSDIHIPDVEPAAFLILLK